MHGCIGIENGDIKRAEKLRGRCFSHADGAG
jgi:hypothetical protein